MSQLGGSFQTTSQRRVIQTESPAELKRKIVQYEGSQSARNLLQREELYRERTKKRKLHRERTQIFLGFSGVFYCVPFVNTWDKTP